MTAYGVRLVGVFHVTDFVWGELDGEGGDGAILIYW